MTRESRTVDQSHQVDSPTQRHLPLVDLLVDTRAELMALAVASGLKVLTTMLEADRTALCGPRYQHQGERAAVRAGTVPSEVVLGGLRVLIRRPRVRARGEEVTPHQNPMPVPRTGFRCARRATASADGRSMSQKNYGPSACSQV